MTALQMSRYFVLQVHSLPMELWLLRQPMMREGIRPPALLPIPTVNLGCSRGAPGWKAQMLGISVQFILILLTKLSGQVPILWPHRGKQIYKGGQRGSSFESCLLIHITKDAPLFWCPGRAPEKAHGIRVESKHPCFWSLMGDFHVQPCFRCIKILLGFSSPGSLKTWCRNDFWRLAGLLCFSENTWIRCLCPVRRGADTCVPGRSIVRRGTSSRILPVFLFCLMVQLTCVLP